jgi:hypothetical protein
MDAATAANADEEMQRKRSRVQKRTGETECTKEGRSAIFARENDAGS